ncbi:MAG: hypothetical protein A2V70_09265 [Planctomycetes bacterium RBG_13_63_9]|nr:MAG: hypothetical protein A2V70_09265 [Planctomycetes bacterium RBG_13_63_9]
MKVAVLSESEVDEAAIRVLVGGLLGREIEPPSNMLPIRSRGYAEVFRILPTILRHLHFNSDAEALVVVLDSDRTAVHQDTHDEPANRNENCRLCRLRATATEILGYLPQRQGFGPLKMAFGLAVPQIEAWCLTGRDRHVGEAGWLVGLQSGRFPYTSNSLTEKAYGVATRSSAQRIKRAVEHAQRIVQQGKLDSMRDLFPGGFRPFADAVRAW